MSGVCERCGLTLAEHFGVAGEFCPRCEEKPKPTAEPDESKLHRSEYDACNRYDHKNCPYPDRCDCDCHVKPTAEPDAACKCAVIDGHVLLDSACQFQGCRRLAHAAGRAEVLKPLRDIYARGRLTFRSDGNPDSVEAQEQEFRAAIRTGDGK